jgi:endonuclease YncB( thermonuclease family)
MRVPFTFFFLFLLSFSAGAGDPVSLAGKVVRVADGDTLVVLQDEKQIKIRLSDIDAPERGQPFASRSRENLAALCAGVVAQVIVAGEDKYGRSLGRVFCNGKDANAEQVLAGMAWVYDRFVTDHSLYNLQNTARLAHRGIWSDENPVPPWVWRQRESKK